MNTFFVPNTSMYVCKLRIYTTSEFKWHLLRITILLAMLGHHVPALSEEFYQI